MLAINDKLKVSSTQRFKKETWKEDLNNHLKYMDDNKTCAGVMFARKDLELLIKLVGEK